MLRLIGCGALLGGWLLLAGCATGNYAGMSTADWNTHAIALDPSPMVRPVSDGNDMMANDADVHDVWRWDLPWRPPPMVDEQGGEEMPEDAGDGGGAAGE